MFGLFGFQINSEYAPQWPGLYGVEQLENIQLYLVTDVIIISVSYDYLYLETRREPLMIRQSVAELATPLLRY